jgi:hypothetical protein
VRYTATAGQYASVSIFLIGNKKSNFFGKEAWWGASITFKQSQSESQSLIPQKTAPNKINQLRDLMRIVAKRKKPQETLIWCGSWGPKLRFVRPMLFQLSYPPAPVIFAYGGPAVNSKVSS